MALNSSTKQYLAYYIRTQANGSLIGACTGSVGRFPSPCDGALIGFEGTVGYGVTGRIAPLRLSDDATNFKFSLYDGITESFWRNNSAESTARTFTPDKLCFFTGTGNGNYPVTGVLFGFSTS